MPGPLCCGRGGIRLGADLQAERAAGLQQRETRQQRATGSAAALAELTATLTKHVPCAQTSVNL